MTEAQQNSTLVKLGDTDRTIASTDDDIRGRVVVDNEGERLGKIHDLLFDDASNEVHFLVVEHGGILGIGAQQSFIPVGAIAAITDDEVVIATDMATVADAPHYDPDIALERSDYEDVYGYYGLTPYWAPKLPGASDRGPDGEGR